MSYRRDTDTDEPLPTGRQNTSIASAKVAGKKKNGLRELIHQAIKFRGGMTCDETEQVLNLKHQSASCIIRFLTQDGFLRDSGRRKPTRSGRHAIVWEAQYPKEPEAVQLNLINDPMKGV